MAGDRLEMPSAREPLERLPRGRGGRVPWGGGGEEAQTQAVPDPRLLSVPSPTTPSAHLSVALSPDPDLGKVSGAPVNCICAKDKKSQPHSA